MKKIFILLAALILIAPTSYAQKSFVEGGGQISFDTTGTFANTTLVGAKGRMKFIGIVDMKTYDKVADSLGLWCSFSDSVQVAFMAVPASRYDIPTAADTSFGRGVPVAEHLWHIQNGAGQVFVPWFRLSGGLTDLNKEATTFYIYAWINKVAGLHTYGTSTTGKAAGRMLIVPALY